MIATAPSDPPPDPDQPQSIDINLSRRLHALKVQEAAIQNRLAELRNAIANLQREERQLGDQVAKLTGVQQALEKKDQELGLPASDEDGGTTAIEARLASVTTFVGVDLEQEKKRILESYGIQPAAAKK